jgi:hypothetical protein
MTASAVKMLNAASPTGVAFIGPKQADGFRVDSIHLAHAFDSSDEAELCAAHFRGWYSGLHGGVEIVVTPVVPAVSQP